MRYMNTVTTTQTIVPSFNVKKLNNILLNVMSGLATIAVVTSFLCLPMILYVVTQTGI
jgi:hypothetical protein